MLAETSGEGLGGGWYFGPRHDRGPLLNATRYLSKSLASESSQRVGRKALGDENMVGFRWTVGASIDTIVWWLLGLSCYGGRDRGNGLRLGWIHLGLSCRKWGPREIGAIRRRGLTVQSELVIRGYFVFK